MHWRLAAASRIAPRARGFITDRLRITADRARSIPRHPPMLAAIEIDGGNPTVGRFEERQSSRTANPFAGSAREPEIRLGRVARQKIRDERRRDGGDVHQAALGIERGALPVRATNRTRQLDRALCLVRAAASNRRRSEQRTRDVLLDDVERFLTKLRCEVDQVVGRRSLAIEWRRLGRERLRRRRALARGRRLWNRPLLDWPHGLSGDTVEDVRESLLRHLYDGLDRPAVDANVGEHRRRRRIEVPAIVMRQLKMPDALAGIGLDADDALSDPVFPEPMAAVH